MNVPALAAIADKLSRRPAWAVGTPYAVAPSLYESGEREMHATLAQRGFVFTPDAALERDHIRHFVLYGTPIVIGHG